MTIFYWIIEYISSFIEAFASFYFCSVFTRINKPVKIYILFSLILATITILLNNIALTSLINIMLMFGLYCLVQFIVQRRITIKTIFIIMLYYSFMFAIDYIFYILISIVTHIQINELIKNMSSQRAATILSTNVIILIVCVCLKKSIKNNYEMESKSSIVLATSTICITVVSLIMYLTQVYQIHYNSQIFMLLFFIILLLMILTTFFFILDIVKRTYEKQEYDMIEKQNTLINRNLDEQEKTLSLWKQSVHDYKNKIIVLNELIKSEQYEKAFEYTSKEVELLKDKAYFISTKNRIVDIILNIKMSVAKENNINFTFNIMLNQEIKIDNFDLSVILGNLIDNAIEAVKNEKEKSVHVQINYIKNLIAIKVINTYSKSTLSFDTLKTNKDFHGIGLKSIKRIVDKYDGDFSIELKNGYVTALVTI